MKRLCLGLFLALALPVSLSAAVLSVNAMQKKVTDLKREKEELRGSLGSLKTVQEKLEAELKTYEESFQERFKRVVSPLLHWPTSLSLNRFRSWTERDHIHLVLKSLQARLIQEPLELIAARELRVKGVTQMRAELEDSLKKLEATEQILELQLEEIKLIQKNTNVRSKKRKS